MNKSHIIKLSKTILDAIYPPACALCGKPLGFRNVNSFFTGTHDICCEELSPVVEPVCAKCGKHIEADKLYCRDCESTEHTFTKATAVFEINAPLKDSIYRFKYKSRQEYAAFFADAIIQKKGALISYWKPDMIIPVPMYYKKEFVRGYNQAAIIADKLSARLGIPTNSDALVRTKKTPPLKELDRATRKESLCGVFSTTGPLSGKTILLIDDIYTTGATLDACAEVLQNAGSKSVYAAVICIGAGL